METKIPAIDCYNDLVEQGDEVMNLKTGDCFEVMFINDNGMIHLDAYFGVWVEVNPKDYQKI